MAKRFIHHRLGICHITGTYHRFESYKLKKKSKVYDPVFVNTLKIVVILLRKLKSNKSEKIPYLLQQWVEFHVVLILRKYELL